MKFKCEIDSKITDIDSRIIDILAEISNIFMEEYHSDIIQSIPEIFEDLAKGNDVYFFVEKQHFDTAERFLDISGKENPTIQDAIECAKTTLGIDFVMKVTPKMDIEILRIFQDNDYEDEQNGFNLQNFKYRLSDLNIKEVSEF